MAGYAARSDCSNSIACLQRRGIDVGVERPDVGERIAHAEELEHHCAGDAGTGQVGFTLASSSGLIFVGNSSDLG